MKKLFLLLTLLVLFSCENNDLDFYNKQVVENVEKRDYSTPLTKSSTIPDPIDQLSGIPVYIKVVGKMNNSQNFLGVNAKGNWVGLQSFDANSLRQKWYIPNRHSIFLDRYVALVGGNSTYKEPIILTTIDSKKKCYPQLHEKISGGTITSTVSALAFNMVPNTSYYYIQSTYPQKLSDPIPSPDSFKSFMQPESSNGYNLIFDNNINKGENTLWQIIPVEEFGIEGISYDLLAGDALSMSPTSIAIRTLVNDTDFPVSRTVRFQESITNTSSFSETKGLKVTLNEKYSTKVGIPLFAEGNIEVGLTTETSWSYTEGKTEQQSSSVTEEFTQTLAPRSTVIARLVGSKYNASVTYTVKLKGLTTGKIIYLNGIWNGVVITETKIELSQPNGQLLKTISVLPK
jgi:hypothetical protein